MEEKTFVGFGYGRFQNDRGEKQEYGNVFMLEDFNGTESNDYHFGSQKAEKLGCVSPDVWKDLNPGELVNLYFTDKKKVALATSLGDCIFLEP